jgi:hypothetical protein
MRNSNREQVVVAGIGDGQERLTAPHRRHLDLEPLPDGRSDDLAAGKVKDVLRDGLPDGMTGGCARLEQPMRRALAYSRELR